VQAAEGVKAFNGWFTEVKKARDKFSAQHNQCWPVPAWAKVVYAAAGRNVADLDGKADEEGFEIVGPCLAGDLKVRCALDGQPVPCTVKTNLMYGRLWKA
jgi:hypothetical protein